MSVIAWHRAEELHNGKLAPGRTATDAVRHRTRHRIIHDVQAGIAIDADLVSGNFDQIGQKLLGFLNTVDHTIVSAVNSSLHFKLEELFSTSIIPMEMSSCSADGFPLDISSFRPIPWIFYIPLPVLPAGFPVLLCFCLCTPSSLPLFLPPEGGTNSGPNRRFGPASFSTAFRRRYFIKKKLIKPIISPFPQTISWKRDSNPRPTDTNQLRYRLRYSSITRTNNIILCAF